MAKGSKVGCKTNDRRKAGSTYRASDQSDEDYTVEDDEEFDESEDGYSSFVGDDSEESLGEYEDEEEELKTRKVKRVVRSRAPSRKKKGTVKPRKRKRVSYREDDDDDGVDEDDEEFTPDCLDEEEEFPIMKGTNSSSKRRLHKGTVKDEDEEFTPDCLDEEEEFPVTKGTNNSSKRRLCKGTVKYEDDEEFTPDCLDDEEDESPVTGWTDNSSKRLLHKAIVKDEDEEDEFTPDCLDDHEEESPVMEGTDNSSKRQLRKTVKDEDEEFTPDCLDEDDDDDEEDESPLMERMDNSSNRRLWKGTFKDEDGEEDEELNPDGLHEEEDFPVMKGMKNSSRLRRRKATAKDDDDDDDEEDKDDEEFTPDDEEEDIPVTKGMKNSSKPRLCKATINNDGEEEEDDDDDEEFTPDGLDEEEEFPEMEGIKYSANARLRKGTAREQKRNRNHKELKKTTRKKPLKRWQLRRKARSENDEEFIDIDPIMKEKNKKNTGQRRKRKRLTVDPDSDFVASSGSSEREFTISEEEREQVREASNFCRSLVTTWRDSASLKKSPREEAPRLQRKHPARKAKEKMELEIEAGKQICGICLSEEGKRTVRGTLNCCSHYFCFACIMEWSKVESRCPLCKQRFVTISKPARSDTGFDLRTVTIQVPERDQVYQPSEEELRGYLDPYENVLCTECQQGGDDALMLLCDLCDSPAHTYCVGLGHEVPEGNWYCESCRPTALASSNPHNLNPMPDNRTSGSFSVGSPPVANVRETFDLNEMYVPDTPLNEESGDFQSPRDGQVSSLASGIGAFTVSDRRRIQRQIHQLLNNRRRQLGNTTGALGAVSGNSLFGSQIARSRELAAQPAIAPRAAPHHSFFRGRQLESDARLSQNRNLAHQRSSNLSGQLNLNGASTSSNSFFGEFLESELQGTDASFSFNMVHQQLHPRNSRSNVGPDARTSPCQVREPAVPTRTLPSSLRRPF